VRSQSDYDFGYAPSHFRAPWWICNVSRKKIRVLMRSELAVSLCFYPQADTPE
jgi:hypothetical protein